MREVRKGRERNERVSYVLELDDGQPLGTVTHGLEILQRERRGMGIRFVAHESSVRSLVLGGMSRNYESVRQCTTDRHNALCAPPSRDCHVTKCCHVVLKGRSEAAHCISCVVLK